MLLRFVSNDIMSRVMNPKALGDLSGYRNYNQPRSDETYSAESTIARPPWQVTRKARFLAGSVTISFGNGTGIQYLTTCGLIDGHIHDVIRVPMLLPRSSK